MGDRHREERQSAAVASVLQGYADRGIFRGFGARSRGNGRLEWRFYWHTEHPHRLAFDPKRSVLSFPDLLPDIPFRSSMDTELRRFLRERTSSELPAHRRIDPERATVRAVNRRGSISVELHVLEGEAEYGARKLIKLVNEIFLGFLAGPYEAYMVKTFGAPEE